MEDKANKAWTELIQEYQIDNAIKQQAFRCLVWVSGSGGVVVLVG